MAIIDKEELKKIEESCVILGLPFNFTEKKLKEAYHKLAMSTHSDLISDSIKELSKGEQEKIKKEQDAKMQLYNNANDILRKYIKEKISKIKEMSNEKKIQVIKSWLNKKRYNNTSLGILYFKYYNDWNNSINTAILDFSKRNHNEDDSVNRYVFLENKLSTIKRNFEQELYKIEEERLKNMNLSQRIVDGVLKRLNKTLYEGMNINALYYKYEEFKRIERGEINKEYKTFLDIILVECINESNSQINYKKVSLIKSIVDKYNHCFKMDGVDRSNDFRICSLKVLKALEIIKLNIYNAGVSNNVPELIISQTINKMYEFSTIDQLERYEKLVINGFKFNKTDVFDGRDKDVTRDLEKYINFERKEEIWIQSTGCKFAGEVVKKGEPSFFNETALNTGSVLNGLSLIIVDDESNKEAKDSIIDSMLIICDMKIRIAQLNDGQIFLELYRKIDGNYASVYVTKGKSLSSVMNILENYIKMHPDFNSFVNITGKQNSINRNR